MEGLMEGWVEGLMETLVVVNAEAFSCTPPVGAMLVSISLLSWGGGGSSGLALDMARCGKECRSSHQGIKFCGGGEGEAILGQLAHPHLGEVRVLGRGGGGKVTSRSSSSLLASAWAKRSFVVILPT